MGAWGQIHQLPGGVPESPVVLIVHLISIFDAVFPKPSGAIPPNPILSRKASIFGCLRERKSRAAPSRATRFQKFG